MFDDNSVYCLEVAFWNTCERSERIPEFRLVDTEIKSLSIGWYQTIPFFILV